MKIKLRASVGTGTRDEVIDTVADWGLAEGEWEAMPSSEQQPYVDDWAFNHIDYGWEPAE